MTEEIIIDCAFYKDGICASPINKTCEYCKNIDVSKCYHKQLKRLEQENKELKAYKDVNEDFKKAWDELNKKYTEVLKLAKENADSNEYCLQELEKENAELKTWLESKEKQLKHLIEYNQNKKDQIKTLRFMLFDEKEIPKDKFTMMYRIAQNERRTRSHRDLCTNITKKYRSALEEIKNYLNTLSSIDSDFPNTETYLRINDKIEEVLNKN